MSHNTEEVDRAAESAAFIRRLGEIVQLCGSVSALARGAGVSEGVIRKWLAGKSDPSRQHLLDLARAALVRPEWLLTGQAPVRDQESDTTELEARLEAKFDRRIQQLRKELLGPKDEPPTNISTNRTIGFESPDLKRS